MTPLLIMASCIWALAHAIDVSIINTIPDLLGSLPLGSFGLAALFCAVSFWAVARYDALAHRHFDTDTKTAQAHRCRFAAIAVAQTVGFGVVTGAAVRWRILPHLTMARALQLSSFVSITFMLSLGFLTALTYTFLSAPAWLTAPSVLALITLPLGFLWLSFAPLGAALRQKRVIPSIWASRAIVGWAALDVSAAAMALYLLIPSAELSFATFLPVFLMALGAALLSGSPGGLGPFELVLLSLLPNVPAPELVVGIVAFRALYYACPAIIGALTMTRPLQAEPRLPTQQSTCLQTREFGILAQNGGHILRRSSGEFAF
jgi:phosphatidylglycerol lysyltransferase